MARISAVVVLDVISSSIVGTPNVLQTVGGVPALDHLLQQLKASEVIEGDILFLGNSNGFNRAFQSYVSTRALLLTNIMLIDTADGLANWQLKMNKSDKTFGFINSRIFLTPASFDFKSITVAHLCDTFVVHNSPAIVIVDATITPQIVLDSSGDNSSDGILRHIISSLDSSIVHETPLLHAYNLTIQSEAEAANSLMLAQIALETSTLPDTVEESCCARVGFIGNPSDGFNGKTVSFLIENFRATVRLEANPAERGIEIVEPMVFSRLDELHLHSTVVGYSTGGRLLQATCKVFSAYCFRRGLSVHLKRCFRMSYRTDIPRMVGLSGSSAIIISTFKCLLRFYGLTLDDLGIEKEVFPQVILDIERQELGISAGLQDRVIQAFGGLVHMDFSTDDNDDSEDGSSSSGEKRERDLASRYTSLDPALLPCMYLAYDVCAGGDSGTVHSTVKDRWAARDPDLVRGMQTLGGYADRAKDCLFSGDTAGLATLMEQNFAMRRALYGDAVVGAKNIAMVSVAKAFGLSAKFTGSGGALLCLRSDGQGWLDPDDEARLTQEYHKHGFSFVRIKIPGVDQRD